MIAAIRMVEGVLPPPTTLDVGIMMMAMLIHVGLFIVLAFLFAFITRGRTVGMTTMMGAEFGLVEYLVNFYEMTAMFSRFAMLCG